LQEKSAKYDRDISVLQNKLEESQEKVFNLDGQLLGKIRDIEREIEIRKNNEFEYQNQIKLKNEEINRLEMKLHQKDQLLINSFKSDDSKDHQKQLENLEAEIKSMKREHNDKVKLLTNSKAILEQRVSFLEQEKEELDAKIIERTNREESIMNMIKKRCQEEQLEATNKFVEDLESKDAQIEELKDELGIPYLSALTVNIEKLKDYYEEELKHNQNNNDEVASEFTSRLREFEASIQIKNQRISELEKSIANLKKSLQQKEVELSQCRLESEGNCANNF
jgi:chromosome segregation ATPase